MKKYKSSNSLKGKTLAQSDKLVIAGFNHYVWSDGLVSVDYKDDGKIFDILGIKDRGKFCALYYGYAEKNTIGFPVSELNDFPALTRLTIALMRLGEFKKVKDAIVECECLSQEPKTAHLADEANEFLVVLQSKSPEKRLTKKEIQKIRNLFCLAEEALKGDQIAA